MKNPLRHEHVALQHAGAGLLATLPAGETIEFGGVDAIVLEAADGSNSIDAILALVRGAANPSATRETVFASLDRLADAGLLQSRVAPPADGNRTSRRDLLRLAGATAASAIMAPAVSAFSQAPDAGRVAEELKKNARAAEEAKKDLAAAEQDAKVVWRAAEETVKNERRDVLGAERDVRTAERELSAAEQHDKRVRSQASEETVKHAEFELSMAQRAAEKEHKDFAAAEARAAESKEKALRIRASEESVKAADPTI